MSKRSKNGKAAGAPRPRRSAAAELERRTELEHAHLNSAAVASRMRVLQCEAEEAERAEGQLRAALEGARARQRAIGAQLDGLRAVLAKRC
jgi:hypothetical protein